ncbi:MAG: hypothetical protein HY852_11780 [Bradyrhizobium sp.]|uniref:alpha/beta hydrolase family protein n=1 Tax=Bradyrhizobium sp. TaxID=376 RepID=UPI0025BCAC5D|nr:hypothetical protein [Bradyrhizobium sp.]MBI5262482.1 hypothetical protein [Bradyrhizobium sp.]
MPDPVNGAAMVGIITYPTTALASSLTVGRFRLAAAEDASPAAGKFPLVIFSHGTGGQPELYLWLFEGLTAKGFVVAGLAHPKDNSKDRSGSFGDALLVDRARHISALIDDVEHDAGLSETIDGEKIGVVGHSAGGYTAILSAGAMPDFSQFKGRCREDAQPGPDRPSFAHNPSSLPVPDRRVRAVAAMAPALGCLFDRDNLSAIHVPIRFYQADNDEVLQPGFNGAYFASQFVQPPDLVHVANAGHFIFLNTCPFIMSLLAREICFDPRGTNRDDVHHRLIEDIALFFRHALDSGLHQNRDDGQ